MKYLAIIRKTCLVVLITLLLSGCTSSVVVRMFYNELDDQLADRFKEYAEFNDRQSQWIDRAASDYQRWHRNTQLPLYADLLDQISATLQSPKAVSKADTEDWAAKVKKHSMQIRMCNPINRSMQLLSGLSNTQAKQVVRHLRIQQGKFGKKYTGETIEQRLARRFDSTVKWSDRAGVTFNEKQRRLLSTTLARQNSLGRERLALRSKWLDEFETLLQTRSEPTFEKQAAAHFEALWTLTEDEHPIKWRDNETLWTDFNYEFIALAEPTQRQQIASTLQKYAAIARRLVATDKSKNTESCAG